MKRYLALFLIALMFCAVVSIGCGGSSDPEQSESLTDDTGSYDPNDEARGNSEEPTDLSTLTENYIAQDGETLTGTLGAIVKISIADGAAVTIRDVTINGVNHYTYRWAGITCEGDATIILEGTNTIKGFYELFPGIHASTDKTLTIKGTGSLTASSNGCGAGIGGGYRVDCGNIVIESGTIIANGGKKSPGIGSGLYGGLYGDFGDITITGGTITATGGEYAAGIGSGKEGICGNITIKETVTKLTATKGNDAPYSIGAGYQGQCGKVIVPREEGAITRKTYTYPEISTDLSTIKADYTVQDDEILTGTLGANVKVSIADGATVTLHNATINGVQHSYDYDWAGLTCEGNATIILKGINSVKGFRWDFPGIYVPPGKTLTINGDGLLSASSNGKGAGIGGGHCIDCGNIELRGGTIYALGGEKAAGIGSGLSGKCGTINITDTVRKVTAIKGDGAPNSIGAGSEGTCGNVWVGWKRVEGKLSPYTYLGNGRNGLGTIDINIKWPEKWTPSGNSAFFGKTMAGLWERLVPCMMKKEYRVYQISKEYVAFGLDVDNKLGKKWPYSGVFWTADSSSLPDKIDITLGGTNNSDIIIEIKFDGKQVLYEYPCSTQPRYDWQKDGRAIHVTTYKTGTYVTNMHTQHMYARKPGGKWECVFEPDVEGNHDFYIDGDYTEFGFEFDINGGRSWPYSQPFWSMSDSEKEKVNDIYIQMLGTTLLPWVRIDVNGRRKVYTGYLDNDKQYKWN